MAMRIVFMGSPEFAVSTLQALADLYPVVGVVTQPDRPAGRGRVLTPPPVKILAQELGIAIIQPDSLREEAGMAQLRSWKPDLIVVTAFGQILRPDVLDLPAFGCLNVHASLLPRWRGAAPIQAAILHGDDLSGVTIMKMDPGVDTGPLLSQESIPIEEYETAGSLSQKLSRLGADLLVLTLPKYLNGEARPQPQLGEPTYAPMLKKSDGELNFVDDAALLERKIRAFNPWPGTYLEWEHGRLKVHRAGVVGSLHIERFEEFPPGERISFGGKPAIIARDGLLILEELQPAGRKSMPGEVFLRGAPSWTNTYINDPSS